MDLKFKKPKWVGSIYHTFEAICHEVDDFVSQETVKFVENQAQTVGGSVKRFYSNVVQDLLPTSFSQHGKHETRVLSLEQKDEQIEEKQVDTVVNDENSNSSLGSEIEDLQDKEPDIVLGVNDKKRELRDNKLTEGIMGRTSSITEENELKDEWTNTNANSVEASDLKIESSLPKERDGWMNVTGYSVEENDLERDISQPTEENEKIDKNAYNDEAIDPTEELSQLKQKEQMNSDANNNEDIEFKEEERELFSFDYKDLPEALISSDIPKIDVTCDTYVCDIEHDQENTCILVDQKENASDPADAISSSQPLTSLSCHDTDTKLALSSSAFDEDIPSADEIAALVKSVEDNQCNDYGHLEALMSFLKVGSEDEYMVDITDSSMVTIELNDDEAKLDQSSVFVENHLLSGVFQRSWKNKSYKKIVQDAFASRKTLRKEYEQLGILCGDVNIESSPRRMYNFLPEIPCSSLGSEKAPSNDLTEWEML